MNVTETVAEFNRLEALRGPLRRVHLKARTKNLPGIRELAERKLAQLDAAQLAVLTGKVG